MATKNLKRDMLRILREFTVAGELSTAADVHACKSAAPRAATQLISAVFLKTHYIAVIDNGADDDIALLQDIVANEFPAIHGHFLRNPKEDAFTTYGIRHKFHDTYLFEAEPSVVRLDKELARRYPDLSRATIQKYIKAGYVQVDGQVVTKASSNVRQVDEIALELPAKQDFSARELPILYIDDDILVINKPSGVLTHSKGVLNDEFTVADFFRRYTTFGLETNRPGIVHRLDRDTSGLLVGARTDEAAAFLKKQFAQRTVKKNYQAVVEGVPKQTKALIDLPIGRNPSAPSTFRVDSKGKPALTAYEVLITDGVRSLLQLLPKTGRTHQLRVHMQYIGTPIVGDRVYGGKGVAATAKVATKVAVAKPESSAKAPTAPRLMLHASSLELTTPSSVRKQFIAPVPPSFEEMVIS